MTDYAPIIPTIGWNNSYSVAFIDLLGVVAAAKVVLAPSATVVDVELGARAKRLLTRELIARLNTGSFVAQPNWDPLIDSTANQVNARIADDFASRAAAASYTHIGGASNRFSVPVPRNGAPDTSELFVQADALAAYQSELAAVLALWPPLMADLATRAAANAGVDSTTAATAAASLASARAAYVSSLSAKYPNRGWA